MNTLNANKTGLAIGGFLGLLHLLWALLVAIGLAQPFINWIFGLHFISPPYTMMPFSFLTALLLFLVASISGYVLGWILAKMWNLFEAKN